MYLEHPEQTTFSKLEQKIVVVTGGASGIGAALVKLLYEYGAHVVFGDIDRDSGEALASALSTRSASAGSASYLYCNVTKYGDTYALFREALDLHGKVDHAVSCAGIVDSPSAPFFDPSLDIDSVATDEGDKSTLEVNFLGTCHFARIALPFLRYGRGNQAGDDRSLTFLSSVTGFRDAPGMFLYQASTPRIFLMLPLLIWL